MKPACVVIVNPTAGNNRAGRAWAAVSRRLEQVGVEHTACLTQRPGQATELCRAALAEGVETIVAAGGDGTLNEVANGFFVPNEPGTLTRPAARLGFLPLGTGSDFARSLGIERRTAVTTLAMDHAALVDVGHVAFHDHHGAPAQRFFLNVADLGLGAETAVRVNRAPKRLGPFATYLIGALRAIVAYRPYTASLRLDDADPIHAPMGLVVVANGRYFGGGMPIVSDAELNDGCLDVVWLAGTSRRRLLFDLLPKLYRGAHLDHPAVRRRRATTLTVESNRRMPLEVDGEAIGQAPATFSILPATLPILTPAPYRVD
jgi:YegS/Rv2252/BmrU family lipid kinase